MAAKEVKNDNYFVLLNSLDVNEHTEKKNGLTYLSWAWAWGELKKRFPLSYYTIYENEKGFNYFTDGKTAWVKTGVTVVMDCTVLKDNLATTVDREIEHIEYLPVMDYRNSSIPVEKITSFDVNKAIQRSLTKAVARHGIGLYIYAGEDMPEGDATQPEQKPKAKEKPKAASDAVKKAFMDICKMFEANPKEILAKAGWKEGDVCTEEIIGKANIILQEMSENK